LEKCCDYGDRNEIINIAQINSADKQFNRFGSELTFATELD